MAEPVVHKLLQHAKRISKPVMRRTLLTEAGESTSIALPEMKQSAANRGEVATTPVPRSLHDLPGPKGYPIVGTIPEYIRKKNWGQSHEVQRRFHQRHGKLFKEKMGPVTNVSLADPSLAEDLLRGEGKHPYRPPYESWVEYKDLRRNTSGLMTAHAEEWHKYRQILGKRLLPPQRVLECADEMNDVVTSMVDRIRYMRDTHGQDNVLPNLPNEMYNFALEAVGAIIFEDRIGCLEKDVDPKVQQFINATGTMFETGQKMVVGAKLHRKLNTSIWRRHVEAWDTILDVARQFIDKRLNEVRGELNSPSESSTPKKGLGFLSYLLAGTKMSIPEIYSNSSELLAAGIETTSNSLVFAFYLLATNPDAQQKLHEEVSRVCQGEICTAEHLHQFSYMKQVVKETLRLYPVIPINARVLTKDCILDNHLIPKGTCVLLNTYTMSRNEEFFEKPDEFIPERWSREEKEFHPFSSLPFGFGSRSCVGRRISELEMYLTLARVSQEFVMKPHETLELKPTVRTVLTPGDKLNLMFEDR
ncbi:cytochrome P450 27C1-like [Liolophura sinensis]|uniref:cytochrome P450 27C1-like n=1 Tax=Liolophura sinensis TaxID=3198878 RepID=UPI0031587B78